MCRPSRGRVPPFIWWDAAPRVGAAHSQNEIPVAALESQGYLCYTVYGQFIPQGLKGETEVDVERADRRADDLVEQIASALERWGLVTPAAFFLEWSRPLSFVGSQFLLLAEPFLAPFVGPQAPADWAALLADRRGVDLLLARLTRGRQARG